MTKTLRKMQQQENGFTLVELLIVVLIVGILAAIAIPVYLGIQAGAHKSAVRSDVNIKVKTIQASLTEGATVSQFLGTTTGTETGETIQVKASTTTGAAANDFMVVGSESTTGSPKAALDYTYTYDSVTGNFTDSDTSNVALGASAPFTPTTVYNPTFTGSSFPSGWSTGGASRGVSNGAVYTDYNVNSSGYITTSSISLAAGTYTAKALMGGYASGGAAFNSAGLQVVNSGNAILADTGSLPIGSTRVTPTFTLASATTVRLTFYYSGGSNTYTGGTVTSPTIQTAQ